MCGRITLSTPAQVVAEHFEVGAVDLAPRYNIAPTQLLAIVREAHPDREKVSGPKGLHTANRERKHVMEKMRWGLVPSWAKEPRIGMRLINARAETVAARPAFRSAFRRRRCLIPADGFYEWQARGRDPKQPFHIRPADGGLFAIAGLFEHWQGGGEAIDSCTVITTEANSAMRPIHPRMPVILPRESWSVWLDAELRETEPLLALLGPAPPESLSIHAVSRRVNNVRNDDAACIEAVPDAGPSAELF